MSFLLDKLNELEKNIKPGHSLDFDGAFPGECADLPRLFIDTYLSIPTSIYVGNNGVLDGYFAHFDPKVVSILPERGTNRRGMKYRTQRITNINDLQRGDIVFRTGWPLDPVIMSTKSKYHNYFNGFDSGHVGILVNRDTPGKYQLFDQNWSPLGGKKIGYSLHDNSSFVGAIRIIFENENNNTVNNQITEHDMTKDKYFTALNEIKNDPKYNWVYDNWGRALGNTDMASQGKEDIAWIKEMIDQVSWKIQDKEKKITQLENKPTEIKEVIKEVPTEIIKEVIVQTEPDLSKYISLEKHNLMLEEIKNNSSNKPALVSKKWLAENISTIISAIITVLPVITWDPNLSWQLNVTRILGAASVALGIKAGNSVYVKEQAKVDVASVTTVTTQVK